MKNLKQLFSSFMNLLWIFLEIHAHTHTCTHTFARFPSLLAEFFQHTYCILWCLGLGSWVHSHEFICWVDLVLLMFLSGSMQDNPHLRWGHILLQQSSIAFLQPTLEVQAFLGWVMPRSHQAGFLHWWMPVRAQHAVLNVGVLRFLNSRVSAQIR